MERFSFPVGKKWSIQLDLAEDERLERRGSLSQYKANVVHTPITVGLDW